MLASKPVSNYKNINTNNSMRFYNSWKQKVSQWESNLPGDLLMQQRHKGWFVTLCGDINMLVKNWHPHKIIYGPKKTPCFLSMWANTLQPNIPKKCKCFCPRGYVFEIRQQRYLCKTSLVVILFSNRH